MGLIEKYTKGLKNLKTEDIEKIIALKLTDLKLARDYDIQASYKLSKCLHCYNDIRIVLVDGIAYIGAGTDQQVAGMGFKVDVELLEEIVSKTK